MPQFNAEFVVVIVGIRRSCRRYPATHKMPEVCQDSADFWGMQSELENPGCSLSEDIHRRTKCASTKRGEQVLLMTLRDGARFVVNGLYTKHLLESLSKSEYELSGRIGKEATRPPDIVQWQARSHHRRIRHSWSECYSTSSALAEGLFGSWNNHRRSRFSLFFDRSKSIVCII
jgi:hypothetical protein